MLPVIMIGTLRLSSYWLMFVVGVCSMGVLMIRRRKEYRLSIARAVLFTLVLAVCGVSGTKLLYLAENWKLMLERGSILGGGLSFFGAVFLIPILMPLVGRLMGLSAGQTLDACASCVASMIGFMRFGCFLNGCCGGWKANVCGIQFQWPTQAMESIGDFLILGILLQMEAQEVHPGRRYAVFMLDYGILRFFVEFLRDTPKGLLALGNGQWFALISIVIGGALLLKEKQRRKDRT